MTLDKHNICVSFFIAEDNWTFLFFMQLRMVAQLKGLFELRSLLYRHELTFPWGEVISLLVWRAIYIYQKYNFFILKTNKQAQPRFKK